MSLTIFLFDVDGVLIDPRGYKEALIATVDRLARQMGQAGMAPTGEDIAVFEACGVTSEWDSAPMCVGMVLAAALSGHPELARPTVEATFEALREAGVGIERPDYQTLARRVAAETPDVEQPTLTILRLLKDGMDATHHPLLNAFLPKVWTLESLTTRVFQHYSLGSERYSATTGQAADFESLSTLLEHDKPVLTAAHKAGLTDAFDEGAIRYAIYTARPSLPPADLPPDTPIPNSLLYPPEADLAAEQIDLAHAPLIAGGRVGWLAATRGKDPAAYLKPSPVQALAAIRAAVTGEEAASLTAAADLAEDRTRVAAFQGMADRPWRVVVFEDSAGGILATRRAVDLLTDVGLPVSFEAVGVATQASKRAALGEMTDRVVGDINEGLEGFL